MVNVAVGGFSANGATLKFRSREKNSVGFSVTQQSNFDQNCTKFRRHKALHGRSVGRAEQQCLKNKENVTYSVEMSKSLLAFIHQNSIFFLLNVINEATR